MSKIFKYRERLLYFIDTVEDNKAMIEWVEEQPDLDHPDILRELKAIYEERHEKTGESDWLEMAKVLEDLIEPFEEAILDEKLAKNLFITEVEKMDIDMEKVASFINNFREHIIKSILSNSEDNEEMWDLAKKVIKAEKQSGIFDPDNWSAIL